MAGNASQPAVLSSGQHSPQCKAEMQRTNASAQQHHRQHLQMQSDSRLLLGGHNVKGEASRPLSAGKENNPIKTPFASSSRADAVDNTSSSSTSSKKVLPALDTCASSMRHGTAVSAGTSPKKREEKKDSRFRSMSPSKRFKGKLKGGEESVVETVRTSREVNEDFMTMLNDLQVPSAMMHKLVSLDARVKEAMLRGRASLTLASLSVAAGGDMSTNPSTLSTRERPALTALLRKTKSNTNLAESHRTADHGEESLPRPQSRSSIFGGPASRTPSGSSSDSSAPVSHPRNHIYSANNASTTSLRRPRSRAASFSSVRSSGSSGRCTDSLVSATTFATMLKANDTSRLEISQIKRMRAILSSESPEWLTEFFDEGGYTALLARLKELLAMEWREEQRDDNLLHELLRCFVALSSTECGRQALSSSLPTPFGELASLLYSEKRPGDLCTRKLLVDLLYILSELPGPPTLASTTAEVRSEHVTSSLTEPVNASQSGPPHLSLLVAILHNMRDNSKEAIVDFIAASHTPRPFKALVTELLNVNRDYFWVFCHGSNRFWALRNINIADVEGPKVPGGMTGGVEFEAMAYQTSLMRLVNLLASRIARIANGDGPRDLAHDLHRHLFSSGLQRALAITRKASQIYYQPLHLELSRYFDYAHRAGFQVPADLEMYQDAPQFLSIAARFMSKDSSEDEGNEELSSRKRTNRSTQPDGIAQATSVAPLSATADPVSFSLTSAPGCSSNESGSGGRKRSREPTTDNEADRNVRHNNTSRHPKQDGIVVDKSTAPAAAVHAPFSSAPMDAVAGGSIVGHAVRQWERFAHASSAKAASPAKRQQQSTKTDHARTPH